jgi:hypothetical protein
VYIARKTTRKPKTIARPMTTLMNGLNPGTLVGVMSEINSSME